MSAICGFLNVRKPAGMTSSDVVEEVRSILGERCGHAGTLDPQAEGVLVIGVGPARKFISYLAGDKEYEGVMLLGMESDTLDSSGTMTLPRRPVTASPDKIRETGADLVGTIDLAVPVYSAVHVGGRRLYELARSGVPVSPPVRPAVIHALEILEICLPPHDRASRVRFRVRCAPGTYVRALTAEWGRRLECGAVLERLTRTRSGPFAIERAITLDKLRELAGTDGVRGVIVPADDALAHLPRASFDDSGARRLRQGQAVPAPGGFEAGSLVRLVLADGLIGVGRVDSDGKHPIVLRPERMISEG